MVLLITKNTIFTILKILILCFGFSIIIPQLILAKNEISFTDSGQYSERTEITTSDTLHNAVRLGNIVLVKNLIKDGFNINLKDDRGWTPLDYAKKGNRSDIEKVLLENGAKTFPKTIRDMVEGPHIRYLDSITFEVSLLNNDSTFGKSFLVSKKHNISELPIKVNGALIEPGDLDLINKPVPPSNIYSGARRIFVVGDIHGEYDRVLRLLIENRIIDNDSKWNWGKGHLVFVGDIFDRGSKVTEALWLILSLEKQAERSGGKVHLLEGNHEPMIFNNDIRYITDEYYSLCENLGLNYSELFDGRSLIGHWLRQKPVMVQINNFVFLHAGISPELCEMELKLDSINKIVWRYFNNIEDEKNVKNRQLILGNKGVLWYRGLVDDGLRKDVIDESILNRALEFYHASSFIIGHTEVDSISSFFGKKVIDVNIPRRNKDIKEQGLLIKGNKLWIVYDSKNRKRI